MNPSKFRFIWQSGYRGEEFLEINQISIHLAKRLQRRRIFRNQQSETRMVCGGHV
jgi:hypothetical protein